MFFTLLLGFSALSVAAVAGYFSVLGIATLFAGSYYQVMIMAASLEFGKLIATSYLYRFWSKTVWWLKLYLVTAVFVLIGVTSLGIFGYLSAAYQVTSSAYGQLDSKISLIEGQKTILAEEIEQNNKRVELLNELRKTQEQRVQEAGNYKLPREQAYAAIEKANIELDSVNSRTQQLREEQFKKDNEILQLQTESAQTKDMGTFKFVAQRINKPIDTIVFGFICVLIAIFDPLAVALVLAFNTAVHGRILKESSSENEESENEELQNSLTTAASTKREIKKRVVPDIGFSVDSPKK